MNRSPQTISTAPDFEGFSLRLLAEQLIALTLVFSVMLLSFGPMLDHHFAERHPGHHHLYLGATNSQHSHDFRTAHAHDESRMYLEVSPAGGDNRPNQIAFLVPGNATVASPADLTAPLVTQSVQFPRGDGAALLRAGYNSRHSLSGTSLAPPVPPPLT